MKKLCQSTMVDGNAGSRLWRDDGLACHGDPRSDSAGIPGRLADMTAINELFYRDL